MLGAKYERLKAFAAEGPVDCLIVGSSVVQQGINPEILSYAYEKETGKPLRCFNFGILGAAAPKIGWITDVLANQYHPRVIIYGVTYRDFLKTTSEATPDTWTAYRLGNFNASGWLADSSYAYRYYATMRYFLVANPATMADREKYEPHIRPDGFIEIIGIWPYLDRSPAPIVPNPYETGAQSLAALREIAALQAEGIDVILVEVPLPPKSKTLLLNGEQDYAVYLHDVEAAARQNGLSFWLSLPPEDIPIKGWADPIHLNWVGAPEYSEWLGRKLAAEWGK
jgi:hypothetical protein